MGTFGRPLRGLALAGALLAGCAPGGEPARRGLTSDGRIEWIDAHVHLIAGRRRQGEDYAGAVELAMLWRD